ncbi:MAG: hypothetical protein AAF512_05255, partial [Pseudomonadota bacterium]
MNNLLGFMSSVISPFERRVLEVLISNDAEETTLRSQMAKMTVVNREHTGVGIYIDFSVSPSAPKLSMTRRFIEQTPLAHLSHPQL